MCKTVGELACGLIGERLRLGDAVGRPAPADKIPAGASGPKRRKVHAPKMKRKCRSGKEISARANHQRQGEQDLSRQDTETTGDTDSAKRGSGKATPAIADEKHASAFDT